MFDISAIRLDCCTMFIQFYFIVGRNAISFKNRRLKLCNLFMNKICSLHTSCNKLTYPVFSNQPHRVCLSYSVNLINNLLLKFFIIDGYITTIT